ncbi:MAG: macro domain-containing protein [Hominenteromicrobium sp.]
MPVQIVRNDITKMHVDAIVNASNRYLRDGSGVNGAIHKAAGPRLLEECRTLGGCRTGEAKITGAYNLPCRYVIHTVGPVWQGGSCGERELLQACYRNSLELALQYDCGSIAFPLISSGVFGYPKDQALSAAMDAISAFMLSSDAAGDLTVFMVVFARESVQIGSKLFSGIEQFIDDHYVDAHTDYRREAARSAMLWDAGSISEMRAAEPAAAPRGMSLDDALNRLDESFSQMVMRKIKENGMKNSECYKKANIDKKLFSKIRSDIHYKPKKQTALALAVALELSLNETKELLMKAGFALSRSEKFDVIVEYFITHGEYDIFVINEALFFYDQVLLGSSMY